jgi:formylglycine-generating enzyme required for sulfatase activity/tRNA A-37 threonylcarbamoyl transferase component Bud32
MDAREPRDGLVDPPDPAADQPAAVQEILAALRRSASAVGGSPAGEGMAPSGGLRPDSLIAGYRIVRHLGRGGMADVYEALHVSLKRRVALKVMREDPDRPDLGARFLREARSMIQVRHPNITAILDAGQVDGLLYLALEFVDGGDVAAAVKRQGRLPLDEALRLMCACAEGMIALHAAGLVHRDLKPANIFLTRDGQPKIGDFGLARQVSGGDRMTVTGASWGTPSFMAPEQIVGAADVDHRADIYALGATFYAVLTGREPFSEATAYLVTFKAMTEEVPDPRRIVPELPSSVVAVIRMATNRERDRRYAGMRALLEDLQRIAQQQRLLHASDARVGPTAAPVAPATVRPLVRPPAPARRTMPRNVVLMIALSLALGWWLWSASAVTPITIPGWAHQHGRDAAGPWVRVVVGEASTRLRYCPPGTFQMGSLPHEALRAADEQLHTVRLSRGFWIQEEECSQAFFAAVTGRNPSRFLGDDLPVEQVTLAEVENFCADLLKRGIPARLPSEAQWEYACRAGSSTAYSDGDELSGALWVARGDLQSIWLREPLQAEAAALEYCAAHEDDLALRTRPVGRSPVNAFALYDLSGNVAEWCAERWDGQQPHSAADQHDPVGHDGDLVVVRGGSWFHPPARARSAARLGVAPQSRLPWLGFRFVVLADDGSAPAPPQ